MNLTRTLTLSLLALVAGAGLARADARADLEGQIETFLSFARLKVWSPGDLARARPAADCTAALARARQAGVSDDADLELYGVDQVMEAPRPGPHSGTRLVAVRDAGKVCAAYDQALAGARITGTIQAAFDLEEWMRLVKPEEVPSEAKDLAAKPEACLAAIDARLAAGATGATKLTIQFKEVTLGEARSRCQRVREDAVKFQEVVNARLAAEAAKRAAKYKAAGIKGDRLELFAYYDMEWYLPGCTASTGDPKRLKQARVLFQWLTAPDGTITIRKFTFRGDKYKTTEKTFALKSAAYKGCR